MLGSKMARSAVSGVYTLSIAPFSFPSVSFILITRFGNKIVGMLYPTGQLHRNQIVAFRATVMQMRIVVPAIAWIYTGMALDLLLCLSSHRTTVHGFPWDVIGKLPCFFDKMRIANGRISDTPAMKGMRTLSHRTAVLGGAYNNSVQGCTDACLSSGYSLAGVEYGRECRRYYLSPRFAAPLTVIPEDCGNVINSHAAPTPLADCSMLCTGNGSEICGGRNRLNLYNNTGTNTGINQGNTPTGSVQTTNLPGNWQYSRCLAYVCLAFLCTRNHSEAAYADS